MDSKKKKLAGMRLLALVDPNQHALIDKLTESEGGQHRCFPLATHEPNPSVDVELREFSNRLLTGGVDLVIFHSIAGTRWIVNRVSQLVGQRRFLESLTDVTTVASRESLQPWQLLPTVELKGKSHWRDIITLLDSEVPVANRSVAIEDSATCHGLIAAIEARGGNALRIPVFDMAPATVPPDVWKKLVDEILQGRFTAVYLGSESLTALLLRAAEARQLTTDLTITLHTLNLVAKEEVCDLLSDLGLLPDAVVATTKRLVDEAESLTAKRKVQISEMRHPAPQDRPSWDDSPFLRACRGEPAEVTPIWMMRQAGRYMAEYRAVRAKVGFLELCANPQLCSEVMCTAVEKLGVDAAIIFSDLLPILVPMGCDLEFVAGDGPVIHNRIREPQDVDRIRPLDSLDELRFVMETVRQTRADLPDHLPLIGFAGAPFTLASYMIEGGASRNYADTKRLMHSDPGAWNELMSHLVISISMYLRGQVDAGAQCLQLFDSWAGCLSDDDYQRFVLPYVQAIIRSIPKHVPVINFATGNPALLPHLANTSAQVIGVDWRVRLDHAWSTVGQDRAVQGNLDPTLLLTNPGAIREAAKSILQQAAGRPGHIFNLGHGILPNTPVENAIALVEIVHELSAR